MTAADYISRLSLQPHPEGGYYKETYRSAFQAAAAGEAPGAAVTSIHYLLEGEDFSAFHRIAYPELWYFHDGEPLAIHEIDAVGNYSARTLGRGEGQHLSLAVEPGTWFAAELPGKTGFSLVSCAVAPGFRFEIFEMARREDLLRHAPARADIIRRLTRD